MYSQILMSQYSMHAYIHNSHKLLGIKLLTMINDDVNSINQFNGHDQGIMFFHVLNSFAARLFIKTHDSESRGQEEAQQCDH